MDRTYGSVPDVSDQSVPHTWTDRSLTFGRLRRRLRRSHTEYCLQYAGKSFILELLILHSRDNWLRLIACWFCSNKWSSSWRLRSYVNGRKPLRADTRRFSPRVKVSLRAWQAPRMWHSTECSFFHSLHLTLWSRRRRIVVQVWIGFHPFFITYI